jgi:hypothetical protein
MFDPTGISTKGKRNQVSDSQTKNLQTYDSSVKMMSKKYHQLNWQHGKIITFIQAKKVKDLSTVD